MTQSARLAMLVAAAAGLGAAAAMDGLLAAVGAARIGGLQLGVAAAPLLALAVVAPIRRALSARPGAALVALGSAWTLAPLIDQHATRAVVVAGALPDVIHHLAGWPALFAGARLIHRPKAALTS
ncbi:MAG TPA: hypothetical protein VGJ70_24395, partial [Solirubrobacteraceae bacterium]